MIYTVTGWRYWYRRYCGWFPIQLCMVCGKAYWGGFPRWWIVKTFRWEDARDNKFPTMLKAVFFHKVGMTWQASWMDYCSQKCCDEDSPEPTYWGESYGAKKDNF